MLHPEQIKLFQSLGYCVVPDFLSNREVAALQAEVERFKTQGLVRNVATDGDGETHSQTTANLQLIPLWNKSDLIRSMPFQEKITGTVSELIGDPFILHLDQMFLKPGRSGIGTSWHQDNAYFRIDDPMKGTAMWIAAHEATLANGTLHVIPGSFREQFHHERDPNSDHHIQCVVPKERAVAIELPAGGVAFFCYGTAHCTQTNTTAKDRAGIAFHFLHTDCIDRAQLLDRETPWAIMTGPEATGGIREYGVRVADTWDKEVQRVLSA